jgi:Flp pilus assembly protein TadG
MPRWRRWTDDGGSAALEFITAGLLLLVPLVYLILAMAAIQGGALSVEGAARQAARVFVQAKTEGSAQSRAQTAVDFALHDFGVSTDGVTIVVTCSPHPSACLTRRGFVTVTVTASVPLPLAPSALNVKTPLAVPLTATSTEQVSRFWSAG